MTTPRWFKVILAVHALVLLAIMVWYFFLGGYLGYGYADLVYVGLMLAAFVGVVVLLFVRFDRTSAWLITVGLLGMDFYIVQVFERVWR